MIVFQKYSPSSSLLLYSPSSHSSFSTSCHSSFSTPSSLSASSSSSSFFFFFSFFSLFFNVFLLSFFSLTRYQALRNCIPSWMMCQSPRDLLHLLRRPVEGMSTPQVYIKVPGVWTGGHEENLR